MIILFWYERKIVFFLWIEPSLKIPVVGRLFQWQEKCYSVHKKWTIALLLQEVGTQLPINIFCQYGRFIILQQSFNQKQSHHLLKRVVSLRKKMAQIKYLMRRIFLDLVHKKISNLLKEIKKTKRTNNYWYIHLNIICRNIVLVNWNKSIYIFENNALWKLCFNVMICWKFWNFLFEYKMSHNTEEIKILMINFW